MPTASQSLMTYLRTVAGAWRDDPRSDAELLTCFAESSDELAFRTLVWRHGQLVWRSCARVLGDGPDTEDAFQSTYLALIRQAGRLRREPLAGWLHRVARRAALDLRDGNRRRRGLEQRLQAAAQPASRGKDADQAELSAALEEELAKLPEQVRVPLVLRYLEGKTQDEVAHVLGCSRFVARKRLTRGENILRRRLQRRGLTVGAGAMAALLADALAAPAMPASLVASTVLAAVAFRNGTLTGGAAELAQRVVKHASAAAPWWKTGWLITLVCIGGLAAGTGGIVWKIGSFGPQADGPSAEVKRGTPSQPRKEKPKTSGVDLYGDPLPPGALVRLGTTRLRILSERLSAGAALSFTADGKSLIIASAKSGVRFAELPSGRLLRKFGRDIRAVAASRDGRIAAGRGSDENGALFLWDLRSGALIRSIEADNVDDKIPLSLSPDGKMAASTKLSGQELHVWEIATCKVLWRWKLPPTAIPEAPKIQFLAYSADSKVLIGADDKEVHVWDARTGKEIRHMAPKKKHGTITACTSSPDGGLAAVAYVNVSSRDLSWQNGFVCLWDVTTGKELRR